MYVQMTVMCHVIGGVEGGGAQPLGFRTEGTVAWIRQPHSGLGCTLQCVEFKNVPIIGSNRNDFQESTAFGTKYRRSERLTTLF